MVAQPADAAAGVLRTETGGAVVLLAAAVAALVWVNVDASSYDSLWERTLAIAADVQISDLGSLAIVAALLAGGFVASLVADRFDPPQTTEEAARRPPRCPRELTTPGPSAQR